MTPKGKLPSRSELIRLTLPQMGLMFCHLAISMTDVWTAGKLSPEAQASIGVVAQIFSLLMLLTSLVASGCMATVSQSLGAGLTLRANRYAGLIIMLSAGMGTLVAALALLCRPVIFHLMGISDDLRPVLSVFFTAYCCQLPFYYVLVMVNSIFRAYKKVLFPLLTILFMTLANLFGDLGFGLGRFSLPAFGAAGIAWTTFACAVLGLLSNLALAARYGLLHRRTFAPWRWNRRAMPYLFRVGMPAAAGQIITHLGSLTTLAIVGLLPNSTDALAGMSVGGRVHAMLLFPLGALHMSMVIVSGHLLGSGERAGPVPVRTPRRAQARARARAAVACTLAAAGSGGGAFFRQRRCAGTGLAVSVLRLPLRAAHGHDGHDERAFLRRGSHRSVLPGRGRHMLDRGHSPFSGHGTRPSSGRRRRVRGRSGHADGGLSLDAAHLSRKEMA